MNLQVPEKRGFLDQLSRHHLLKMDCKDLVRNSCKSNFGIYPCILNRELLEC
jgi:hypothetical protein